MSSTDHICIDSKQIPWTAESNAGIEHKPLSSLDGPGNFKCSLIRLATGAQLPALPAGSGMELLVLEGEIEFPEGRLGVDGYARRSSSQLGQESTTGCTLFCRSGPFPGGDTQLVHCDSKQHPWSPGHGNLQVKPLHSIGNEGCALVFWPAGERFLPHQHFGGEEIFVLSGTFQDEHGQYPAGTWLQSPHLSKHHPFVKEETVIFVKTGHLPATSE